MQRISRKDDEAGFGHVRHMNKIGLVELRCHNGPMVQHIY
jgi:hypothetical protein